MTGPTNHFRISFAPLLSLVGVYHKVTLRGGSLVRGLSTVSSGHFSEGHFRVTCAACLRGSPSPRQPLENVVQHKKNDNFK